MNLVRKILGSASVTLLAASLMVTPAMAAKPAKPAAPKGDAAHGKTLFDQCKICHSLDAGKNMIGPSLKGVVGRPAASAAGFTYSPAMKASKLRWAPATLSEFLTAPMKKVPGTRMAFAGLAKPQDRDDLIAFLAKN